MFKDANRILLIHGCRIGDQLQITPFIRCLRKAYPSSYICSFTGLPAKRLIENNPYLDELVVFDRSIFKKIMLMEPFDLAIDLVGHHDAAYLAHISKAKWRVGFLRVGLPETKPELYNIKIDNLPPNSPFLDRYLHLGKVLGIRPDGRRTQIFLKPEEMAFADSIFRKMEISEDEFIIGMHPGGSRTKILWETKKYASLADELIRRERARLIFFHGPGEMPIVDAVVKMMKSKDYIISPRVEVRILAGLISKCNLLITSDRGPMHIATAMATPTIGIFGPFSVQEYFPYSSKSGNAAISKGLSCQPCGMGYKRCSHINCLRLLTVSDVLEGVEKCLEIIKDHKIDMVNSITIENDKAL